MNINSKVKIIATEVDGISLKNDKIHIGDIGKIVDFNEGKNAFAIEFNKNVDGWKLNDNSKGKKCWWVKKEMIEEIIE